jgi:uracil-DNA glycosylase family 4
MNQENKKLLQLYFEAGIDEIISEAPINRLIPKPRQDKEISEAQINTNIATEKMVDLPQIKPSPLNNFGKNQSSGNEGLTSKINTFDAISKLASRTNSQPMNTQTLIPIKEIISGAKKMAESCKDLQELEKVVRDFEGCGLKKMATNTVFADGNPNSKIMIIGEAPGNHEDLQGIPFCGDSGKLLNSMFKAIGFNREDLYITNTLFWRPPGNRRPTPDELAMCEPFVQKHIALIKPKLIVLMGATAMVDVLKIEEPISKMRGKLFDYQNQYLENAIKSTVLFHPSYLMRQSSKKRETWLDLLMIKEFLNK